MINRASRDTLKALAAFFDRPALVMLALGFAAGLPNLLIFDTLSVWLRQAGLALDVITMISLVTLFYSVKFLWAPLVDRLAIPGLTALLGRRRAWMLVCQTAIILGLWLIAAMGPDVSAAVARGEAAPGAIQSGLVACVLMAAFVGFASATQDIVIDAWRIEAASTERQGVMAAAYQWGYRIAIIAAGVVPLLLATRIGWSGSYAAMAIAMGIGVLGVFTAPRETSVAAPSKVSAPPGEAWAEILEWTARILLLVVGGAIAGAGLSGKPAPIVYLCDLLHLDALAISVAQLWAIKPWGVLAHLGAVIVGGGLIVLGAMPVPGLASRPSAYFANALGAPLVDFFTRHRGTASLILAMICVYRIADFALNLMGAFYVDVGFSLDEIAGARKGFGVVMSMLGVGVGGYAVARYGLYGPLVVGALAQPVSNLTFAALALSGPDLPLLYVCIAIDNLSAGFAGTCLIAYMSSLTSAGFTATQYALFSSLYALPGKILGAISGRIVEGAAHAAAPGGVLAAFAPLVGALPIEAFSAPAAKAGIPASAYAIGYVTFFAYSAVIGVVAVVLSLAIARIRPRAAQGARAVI